MSNMHFAVFELNSANSQISTNYTIIRTQYTREAAKEYIMTVLIFYQSCKFSYAACYPHLTDYCVCNVKLKF